MKRVPCTGTRIEPESSCWIRSSGWKLGDSRKEHVTGHLSAGRMTWFLGSSSRWYLCLTDPQTRQASSAIRPGFESDDSKVLLGVKKRGFGQGILNGFGGMVEKNESVDQGAIRELEEESGLKGCLERKGRLVIFVPQQASGIVSESPRVKIDIALYACYRWSGSPRETEEMAPEWHSAAELPFARMWPEAPLYLPLVWEAPKQIAIRVEYEQVEGHDKITGWSTALHE